jgi:hypothetical protein
MGHNTMEKGNIMDSQREIVCYHEAGHAVVAFSHGAQFQEVCIEQDKGPHASEWSEWCGDVRGVSKETNLLVRTCIAWAGPLAEAKFLADWKAPGSKFANLTGNTFVEQVLRWDEEDGGNLSLKLEFENAGNRTPEKVEVLEGDIKMLRGDSPDEKIISEALARTKDLLDQSQVWAFVLALGKHLIQQEVTRINRVSVDWESIKYIHDQHES